MYQETMNSVLNTGWCVQFCHNFVQYSGSKHCTSVLCYNTNPCRFCLKSRFSSYFVYFAVKYYVQQQPVTYFHYEETWASLVLSNLIFKVNFSSKLSTSIHWDLLLFIQVNVAAGFRLKSISQKIIQCYYAEPVFIPPKNVMLQKFCLRVEADVKTVYARVVVETGVGKEVDALSEYAGALVVLDRVHKTQIRPLKLL